MTKTLHRGDKAEWEFSAGHSTEKVVRNVSSTTHIQRHKVAAPEDEPQYFVESAQSGGRAAHIREALTRV